MITLVGVGILAVLWGFAVICVLGLVSFVGRSLTSEPHPRVDAFVGLLFVAILALAPLAMLVLLRAN